MVSSKMAYSSRDGLAEKINATIPSDSQFKLSVYISLSFSKGFNFTPAPGGKSQKSK